MNEKFLERKVEASRGQGNISEKKNGDLENTEVSEYTKNKNNETNGEVVDWFSTLDETKKAMRRLYKEAHRTPEAKQVWDKLPGFLEENKGLLSFLVGTEEFAVHIQGSMLVGVGTEGKKNKNASPDSQEISPSDIDFLIFVGDKDDRENKYQAKYVAEDKDLPDDLRESARLARFFAQSDFSKEFNFHGDGFIVDMAELAMKMKEICNKLSKGGAIEEGTEEGMNIYRAAVMFGSDALFQGKHGTESKWRNEILKIILENPGGEKLWNEGIKKYFNLYIANYEYNALTPARKEKQRKRVDMAFDKILDEKKVSPDRRNQAKQALSKMRSELILPEFETIKGALEGKISDVKNKSRINEKEEIEKARQDLLKKYDEK